MKTFIKIIFAVAMTSCSVFGQGTFVLWDESVNGLLSNDGGNPTPIGLFQNGTNSMLGVTEFVRTGSSGALYGDYFTFAVPQSHRLHEIMLNVDRQVSIWIGNPGFGEPLSYIYNPLNGGLLSQMTLPPLDAGSYGMYIKMNAFSQSDVATYGFDFMVQPVPEPNTIALFFVTGFAFLGFKRRFR